MTRHGRRTKNLMEVRDLQVHFALHGTFRSRITGRGGGSVKAVDGVSFDLREGEVLGLVGESGSGKTTLGRALLGLVRPTGGSVKLRGEELAGLPERQLRPKRRHLQMVFQDPHASLNPGMTLETALAHPLQIHKLTKGDAETEAKVRETLELVGLVAGRAVRRRAYPADLSGGQKQRAAIARAIIVGPDLLVADEPVSMLDMSVRAKILDLMIDLKNAARADVRLRHARPGAARSSSATAWRSCTSGRIVEIGTVERDLQRPQAPVHAGADPGDPGARPGQGAPARPAARRGARRGAPAAGLLVPPALPEGVRASAAGRRRDLRVDPRRALDRTPARRPTRPSAALFGDLEKLEVGHEAFVPAGSGKRPGRAGQDARADPRRGARRAAVEGRQGDDRRDARRARDVRARASTRELYDTGGARAACLLYKPDLRHCRTAPSGLLPSAARQERRRSGRLPVTAHWGRDFHEVDGRGGVLAVAAALRCPRPLRPRTSRRRSTAGRPGPAEHDVRRLQADPGRRLGDQRRGPDGPRSSRSRSSRSTSPTSRS